VYVFGSNSNQNAVAPDVTLGSVVIDLPHAFLTVAREVKDGRFKPRVIELGSGTDVVRLELNAALETRIPPTVRRAVDSVATQLRAGTFKPLGGGR
jgi:basic membrane protein A